MSPGRHAPISQENQATMNAEYQIRTVDTPDDAIWTAIGGGIKAYNQDQAGADQAKVFCVILYGPDGRVAGGVICEIYWHWLYVNLMWIEEPLRGLGYGQRLLVSAEDEARRLGAKQAYLDTFSFQAPDFYKKQGYRVFGELRDFPAGHQRYFLTKQL